MKLGQLKRNFEDPDFHYLPDRDQDDDYPGFETDEECDAFYEKRRNRQDRAYEAFRKRCERPFAVAEAVLLGSLERGFWDGHINPLEPKLVSSTDPWQGLPEHLEIILDEDFAPGTKEEDRDYLRFKAERKREALFQDDHARNGVNAEIASMHRSFGGLSMFLLHDIASKQGAATQLDGRNHVRAMSLLCPPDVNAKLADYLNQPNTQLGNQTGSIERLDDRLVLNFTRRRPLAVDPDKLNLALFWAQDKCEEVDSRHSFAWPAFFEVVRRAVDSKQAPQHLDPAQWCAEQMQVAFGVMWQLMDDDINFRIVEQAYKYISQTVCNLSPPELAKPVEVPLSGRNQNWCDKLQSQLGEQCTPEIMFLCTRSSLQSTFRQAVRQNAFWFYQLVEDFNVLINHGVVVTDFVKVIHRLKKQTSSTEEAIKTAVNLALAIYASGKTLPWYFKENFDLLAEFEDLPLETRLRLAQQVGTDYQHVVPVYVQSGTALIDCGFSEDEAVAFTHRVVKAFGINNPARAIQLVDDLVATIDEDRTADPKKLMADYQVLLDKNQPHSEIVGLLEGKGVTVDRPAIASLMVMTGKVAPNELRECSVNSQMITNCVPEYLRKPRSERAPSKMLTNDRHEKLVDSLVVDGSEIRALPAPNSKSDILPLGAIHPLQSLNQFYARLYTECSGRHGYIAGFYFGACAGFFPDPLNPPAGFLKHLQKFCGLRNPGENHNWIFAMPGGEERKEIHRKNARSELNRNSVIHNVLTLWNQGVLSWDQIEDWFEWLLYSDQKIDKKALRRKLIKEEFADQVSQLMNFLADNEELIDPEDYGLYPQINGSELEYAPEISMRELRRCVARSVEDIIDDTANQNLAKTIFVLNFLRSAGVLAKAGVINKEQLVTVAGNMMEVVKSLDDFDKEVMTELFHPSSEDWHTIEEALKLGIFDSEQFIADAKAITSGSISQFTELFNNVANDLRAIIATHQDLRQKIEEEEDFEAFDPFSFREVWESCRYLRPEGLAAFIDSFGWSSKYGEVWRAASLLPLSEETATASGHAHSATRASILTGLLLATRKTEGDEVPLLITDQAEDQIEATNLPVSAELEQFFPLFKERILASRERYFGMMPIAGKTHLHGAFDAKLFDRLRRFLGLNQTSFKLIHARESLCLPPMPTSEELALFTRLLQSEGLITPDSPEMQIACAVRLPNYECGISASTMLLTTEVTTKFKKNSFKTNRDSDTGARMMAYDARGYSEIDAPFVPKGNWGRTDKLGSMHIGDFHRYWIVHNILAQQITGQSMGVLAEEFKADHKEILGDYGLLKVLKAPWVYESEEAKGKPFDPRHISAGIAPCQNAYYSAFEAYGRGEACIISDMRDLVDKYDDKVQKLSQDLWQDERYAIEKQALTSF